MPPKETAVSPAVSAAAGLLWLLFMSGMAAGYIVMLVSWWRAMKAHEKIAEKLGEIAEKLKG